MMADKRIFNPWKLQGVNVGQGSADNPYLSPAAVVGSVDVVVDSAGSVPSVQQTVGFRIDDLADRYRINDILYDGGLCVVDMRKKLLDDGKSHDQEDWISMTQSGDWRLQVLHCTMQSSCRCMIIKIILILLRRFWSKSSGGS